MKRKAPTAKSYLELTKNFVFFGDHASVPYKGFVIDVNPHTWNEKLYQVRVHDDDEERLLIVEFNRQPGLHAAMAMACSMIDSWEKNHKTYTKASEE